MSNNEVENFKNIKTIWKNTFDKILEIKVSTFSIYQIANKRNLDKSKKEIFDEEKKKIDLKYDKKYKEEVINTKIGFSTKKNEANLTKIEKRNQFLMQAIEDTKSKLSTFANPKNNDYKELLKKLIIQGMTQMLEPECVIRVRKQDENLVGGILEECEKEFTKIMKDATERNYECSLSVDSEYLDCQQ